MDVLKIPYGLNDSDELIPAEAAQKGQAYRCPGCNGDLIQRTGSIRTKHFSHAVDSPCSLESVIHLTAKRLVKSAIQDNAKHNTPLLLENHCAGCGVVFDTALPPGTFSDASEEVRIGSYVCDVVGYTDNQIRLAIEILHTHEVDHAKAADLACHWIELKAEDVIASPRNWRPVQSSLKDVFCRECKQEIQRTTLVADRCGIDRSLYSPIMDPAKATYIAAVETCFKCKQETPVFWWPGVPFCENEPPSPRPKTIKHRHSKQYGGAYWANTCAHCGILLGDNFLFLFDNAPFRGLPMAGADQTGIKIRSGKDAEKALWDVLNRNFPR